VAQLAVSSDGQRVLFDHGEELRILDRNDGASVGWLRGRRQGRFQGLALFSPSNRLLLAGASNGRLQLWRVPATPEQITQLRQGYAHGFRRNSLLALGGLTPAGPFPAWAGLATDGGALPQLWALHGQEVRQFLTPGTGAVTCGAFAPDESVVFTGGADRTVRVWAVPPTGQWDRAREAMITFVGSQVERGTDQVRIRAEMDNPDDPAARLRPGTYADLRLYPETAPAK
jgi:WD40 repeat protein